MFKFLSKNKDKYQANSSTSIDWLIVGLGNPGKKYENSRHNVGFMFIDHFSHMLNQKINKIKFKGLWGKMNVQGKNVILLKPSTYMNLSGQSVVEAMNFYKLKPEQVLVVFDDVSLPVGSIRIRRKGSDGGHNGMKNIIYLTGSDMFPRIKIGVGSKPHPDYNLADWVLSAFEANEQKPLKEAISNGVKAAELIITDKTDEAMSNYN